MKRTETIFIELIADEGFELFNGEISTNRVTASLGSDLSNWIEREIVVLTEKDIVIQNLKGDFLIK